MKSVSALERGANCLPESLSEVVITGNEISFLEINKQTDVPTQGREREREKEREKEKEKERE